MSLCLLPRVPSLGMIGKSLAPPFLHSPFQVLVYIDEIPEISLFSRLSSPSSLTFPHRRDATVPSSSSWLFPLNSLCKCVIDTSVQLSEFVLCFPDALGWRVNSSDRGRTKIELSLEGAHHSSRFIDGLQKMFFSWCYYIQNLRRIVCDLCSPMFLFGRRNTSNKCPEGARTVILRNSFWHSS